MSERRVLVNENSLKAIGDAIREQTGETTSYKPGEMADAILAISTGGESIQEIFVGTEDPGETVDALIWINPEGDETTVFATVEDVEAKGYQTEEQVNSLINAALGVIENGTY